MSVAPKSVTIDLRALSRDADAIVDATDRLYEIAERLRDLADPRLPLPARPDLAEKVREWAADLEQARSELWTLADGITDRVDDALADDDDDELALRRALRQGPEGG